MRTASKTLYLIGYIFNIIDIVFMIITLIVGAVGLGSAALIAQIAEDTKQSVPYIHNVLLVMVIAIAISLVVHFIILLLVGRARRNLNQANGKVSAHVFLLVLGILGMNIFYFLGSIFGLVTAGEDSGRVD